MWEILVPTQFEDTKKPVRVRHHREWDKYVRGISGGLTILKPAKGQWVHKGELYEDRMIPVRIVCTRKEIELICAFTKRHYRQITVLAYEISQNTIFFDDDYAALVGLRQDNLATLRYRAP